MKKELHTPYKQEVSEIKLIEFYFSDYLLVNRAERTNIVYNLLNLEMNISQFQIKYYEYLEGYSIRLVNDKRLINEDIFKLTNNSKVELFYSEYRICFLLDISHSLLTYDFTCQMINIEKIEFYLKSIFEDLLKFKKGIKSLDQEDYLYSPKLIVSLVAMGTNEDNCDILVHEIYLEKTNFEEHFDMIMRKLKRIIIDSQHNLKKLQEKNEKNNDYFKIHTTYLNKMLDQSLYILDLLPKKAAPVLIIFTDSNLYIDKLGNYNNILMQLNRIDININIVNIHSALNELNLLSLGFTNNDLQMKFICNFTGGLYFNEQCLIKLLKIERNIEKTRNIVNLNKNHKEKENTPNLDVDFEFEEKGSFSYHIFCKEPLRERKLADFIKVNNDTLQLMFLNSQIDEAGFNLFAIQEFKLLKEMKIYQKEKFESYKLRIPFQRIIEIRIRESFFLLKNKLSKYNYNSRLKFEIILLPNIIISYIIKDKSINEKNIVSDDKSEKIIKIKVKAPFYLFNYLKKEYLKNKNNMTFNTSNTNKKNIGKILNFIKEVMCSDKLLHNMYNRFINDFDVKNPNERENFIKSNSNLWEILSNLPLHTWHRFFNVEIIEFLISNKDMKNIDYSINNFWNNQTNNQINEFFMSELQNKCERAVKALNCEIEMNDFKIKLLDKSMNQRTNKKQNGFCLIKYIKVYDNVGVIYLGFFQSFISIRKKLYEQLKESFEKEDMKCSIRHLLLLLPSISENNDLKSSYFYTASPSDKKVEKDEKKPRISTQLLDSDTLASSIFTYRPYKKLIDSYIFKKTYKHITSNKFVMEKFLNFIIKLRIHEDYLHINSCNNRYILVNKISISKVKNINEVDKIIPKRSLVIYILQLNQTKDELSFELCIEPVSGYYLYKFSETEARIFDEAKFFNSLTNYYKTFDKHIFESIFNFCFLARETIEAKLKKTSYQNDPKKRFNNSNDILFDSDCCLFEKNLLNDIKRQVQLKKHYEDDLKEYLEQLNDDKIVTDKAIKTKQKINEDEIYAKLVQSLELVESKEYKIATLTSKNEMSIDLAEDFQSYFFKFFQFIMDHQFYTDDTHYYFSKIITRNTVIVVKFPELNRLLKCCEDQLMKHSESKSFDLFIHLKIYFLSLDKLQFNEKKFTDFLLEKSSIKTIEISKSNKELSTKLNEIEENFWNKDFTNDKKTYGNNEIYNSSPKEIVRNFIDFIERYYEVIYYKALLISISDNYDNIIELNKLKNYASKYIIKIDISQIFLKLNKKNEGCLGFVSTKIFNIINDNFEKLNKTSNLYFSRSIREEKYSNPESNTSYTEDKEKYLQLTFDKEQTAYNLKKKNIFFIEFKISENCDNENKIDLNLNSINSVLIEIYNKVKNLKDNDRQLLSVNILMKIYTIPEICDMYSEKYVDEYLSKNCKPNNLNFDIDYLQFYEVNSLANNKYNTGESENLIPLYIQSPNKNYYILISDHHKKYFNKIFNTFKSLENLIFLEDLRIIENTSSKTKNLNYYKIDELVSTIESDNFTEDSCEFPVIDKDEFYKNLIEEENDRNIIVLYRNEQKKCCYYLDFERPEENLLNLKKYYFENLEYIKEKNFEDYKLPTWFKFMISSQSKNDESWVKFSYKWIYLKKENSLKFDDNFTKLINELFKNFTKKSNKKILINKLKMTNHCDSRLFPTEEDEIKQVIKRRSKTLENSVGGMLIEDKLLNIKENDKSDYVLDLQYRSEFNVDSNIEDVYNKIREEFNKSNNLILNRQDIYMISDPSNDNNLYIFKILLSEKKIAQTSSSFIHDNILNKNQRQGFSINSMDTINRSNINDSKLVNSSQASHKKKSLILEIYGIQKVNNIIIKQLYEFIQEKILIYKLNFYHFVLKSFEGKYNDELDSLIKIPQSNLKDYGDKIIKTITDCFQTSLNHWITLFQDPSKITENQFQLIYTFSDKIDLTSIDSNFSVLTKLNSSLYFENLVEYFKLFRKNKIAIFSKKMFIIPELTNYIFIAHLESGNDTIEEKTIIFEMLLKKDSLDSSEKLNDLVISNSEVSEIIYKFIEDLLYVSYLLVIKPKK